MGLKIGDEVNSKHGISKITSIDLCYSDTWDESNCVSIPYVSDELKPHCFITLDNGHWSYGIDVTPIEKTQLESTEKVTIKSLREIKGESRTRYAINFLDDVREFLISIFGRNKVFSQAINDKMDVFVEMIERNDLVRAQEVFKMYKERCEQEMKSNILGKPKDWYKAAQRAYEVEKAYNKPESKRLERNVYENISGLMIYKMLTEAIGVNSTNSILETETNGLNQIQENDILYELIKQIEQTVGEEDFYSYEFRVGELNCEISFNLSYEFFGKKPSDILIENLDIYIYDRNDDNLTNLTSTEFDVKLKKIAYNVIDKKLDDYFTEEY